jgi:hypothetical protein
MRDEAAAQGRKGRYKLKVNNNNKNNYYYFHCSLR